MLFTNIKIKNLSTAFLILAIIIIMLYHFLGNLMQGVEVWQDISIRDIARFIGHTAAGQNNWGAAHVVYALTIAADHHPVK